MLGLKRLGIMLVKTNGSPCGPSDHGWGPQYYWSTEYGSNSASSGVTPRECRQKSLAWIWEQIHEEARKSFPSWVFPTAPFKYSCGASGKIYATMVWSPMATRLWVAIRKALAAHIAGKGWAHDKKMYSDLWSQWFYGSEHPQFPWLAWACAVRHATKGVSTPANRDEARWHNRHRVCS